MLPFIKKVNHPPELSMAVITHPDKVRGRRADNHPAQVLQQPSFYTRSLTGVHSCLLSIGCTHHPPFAGR
jgi:hypothetical protein